jgi:hypothetical protein
MLLRDSLVEPALGIGGGRGLGDGRLSAKSLRDGDRKHGGNYQDTSRKNGAHGSPIIELNLGRAAGFRAADDFPPTTAIKSSEPHRKNDEQ